MHNQAWVFKADPNGPFVAKESVELRDVEKVIECPEGCILVKTLAVPVSPSFRARMRSGKPDSALSISEDFPWWKEGDVFVSELLGEVVESRSRAFKVGDRVTGWYPLQRYFVARADGSDRPTRMAPQKVSPTVPMEKAFAVSGALSAFMAIEYAHETPAAARYAGAAGGSCGCLDGVRALLGGSDRRYAGKVAVVTAAASTVGSVAGQLYKLKGCRKVIGVTSTKKKAEQLLALGGFDAAIAYKEEDLDKRLKELAPEGVDIDFENAGGPILDTVLRHMNKFGKVILCGNMYDQDKANADVHGIKEYGLLVANSIEITGYFILDYMSRMIRSFIKLSYYVSSGKVKTMETVVHGFERWGEAVEMLWRSENAGRLVLIL